MVKKRLSLNSAYKLVWDAREAVRPNPGFWKQLRMLEKQVAESGAALDNSLKLGDDARDRRALHNIEALDSESRLVPAMGTAVTFSLKVADAREANIKLTNRHVCRQRPFFCHVCSPVTRTVNAVIGGVVQNVDVLSPSSVGSVVYRH